MIASAVWTVLSLVFLDFFGFIFLKD